MKKQIIQLIFIATFLAACNLEEIPSGSTPQIVELTEGDNAFLHGLSSQSNNNYCNYDGLAASSWVYSSTQAPTRAILRFTFPESITNTTIVKTAKLVLTSYINSSNTGQVNHSQKDNALEIVRVPNDWKCSTVTWNNQPEVGTNLVKIDTVGVLTGINDNQTVDVTALVNEMIKNGNFGFLLKLKDEKKYYSSRWFGAFSSPIDRRPKLIIEL